MVLDKRPRNERIPSSAAREMKHDGTSKPRQVATTPPVKRLLREPAQALKSWGPPTKQPPWHSIACSQRVGVSLGFDFSAARLWPHACAQTGKLDSEVIQRPRPKLALSNPSLHETSPGQTACNNNKKNKMRLYNVYTPISFSFRLVEQVLIDSEIHPFEWKWSARIRVSAPNTGPVPVAEDVGALLLTASSCSAVKVWRGVCGSLAAEPLQNVWPMSIWPTTSSICECHPTNPPTHPPQPPQPPQPTQPTHPRYYYRNYNFKI